MQGSSQERVVRIVLPVELIRRLDEALLRRVSGFETRTEFIREAVENMLLELEYEPAQPEPGSPLTPGLPSLYETEPEPGNLRRGDRRLSGGNGTPRRPMRTETEPAVELDSTSGGPPDLSATVLAAPARGAMIRDGIAEVEDEPLFGLHNRDYPSIWAAHRLAAFTQEGPVPLPHYLHKVVDEAWAYARFLQQIELRAKGKLSVMFPRNAQKPQSAEEGFRTFAVGATSARGTDGRVSASGPLFGWKVCQLQRRDREIYVGLTESGYELLEALDGISLEIPHPPKLAERFFAHLRRFAPADWWGFETVLAAAREEPDRHDLQESFRLARPDWSGAVVGTNTQGYVGRAREWGLLEPKLARGRYLLTDFGRTVLENTNES